MQLREGPSGNILKGQHDGDVLTWDATAQEWFPAASGGTVLPDGTYQNEPVGWDTDSESYVPTSILNLSRINDANGAGFTLNSTGFVSVSTPAQINVVSDTGINFAAGPGSTILLDGPLVQLRDGVGNTLLLAGTGGIGFFGHARAPKPTVTGSKGANAALTSLLAALVGLGLLTDSTT